MSRERIGLPISAEAKAWVRGVLDADPPPIGADDAAHARWWDDMAGATSVLYEFALTEGDHANAETLRDLQESADRAARRLRRGVL